MDSTQIKKRIFFRGSEDDPNYQEQHYNMKSSDVKTVGQSLVDTSRTVLRYGIIPFILYIGTIYCPFLRHEIRDAKHDDDYDKAWHGRKQKFTGQVSLHYSLLQLPKEKK